VNRRTLAIGAAIALPAGFATFHSEAAAASSYPSNPDAELIRLCGEYVAAVDAYNQSIDEAEPEDDPLWQAVEDLEVKLAGLNAQTVEGVAANARVVMRLSRKTDGTHDFSSSHTGDWSEQVVRDLLRLMGDSA
jgi:hypothetical protein